MKMKSIVLLIMATGCGLVAMLGVQKVLSGSKGKKTATSRVLIATLEIAPGIALDETNVIFKEWPANAIPEGAVTSEEEIENRALRIRAVAGEVIMLSKLGGEGELGASNAIPKGMRAVDVSVDATKGSSGMILPGDFVDVSVTFNVDGGTRSGSEAIKTALEDVQVFQVGNQRDVSHFGTEEDNNKKDKSISLLVTPEEASLLKLIERRGRIHLMLRGKGDRLKNKQVRTVEDIFGVPETVEEAVAVAQPETLPVAVAQSEALPVADESFDVRSFLENLTNDKGEGPTTDELATDEPEVVETPKWKIEIFVDSKKEVIEVDFPDDELEEMRKATEEEEKELAPTVPAS